MNPISPILTAQTEPSPTEAAALPPADRAFEDLLSQLMPAPENASTATECAPKLDLLLQEAEPQTPLEIIPEATPLHPGDAKTKGPRIPDAGAPETPTVNPNWIAFISLATLVCPQPAAAPSSSNKMTLTEPENVFPRVTPNEGSTSVTLGVEPAVMSFSVEKGAPGFTLNERSTSPTLPPTPSGAVLIPLIGVRSIETERESVQLHSLPVPEPPATPPPAPVKAETEITLNLPRPIETLNKAEIKEPSAPEPQTGNFVLAGVHHEAKSITLGGPALSFGSQQNPPEHFDKPVKASPKYDGHIVTVANADARETAHSELPPTAPVETPPPLEMPVLPAMQVARRVSIDIGDDDSKVRITIHERAGDVSVRFDTTTQSLKSDLQSSVGSLIEALRREHVPLANLDFTNTLVNADSNRQREQRQAAKMVRRQAALSEFAVSDIEVNRSGNSINIHA